MPDRVLDRLVSFDERSRGYPIRTLLGPRQPRSYTWSCGVQLNQGQEGACVGFGWAQELAARPVVVSGMDSDYALYLYRTAQTLDEWPGESYQGSSVLAGAKAVQAAGFIDEYRWAFGLDDVLATLGYFGPVVLGLNWYAGMFMPSESTHLIAPTGDLAGGHCILANGVSVKLGRVRLHNSWGADWGVNGDCFIGFDDLDRLLHERGEACVPVRRRQVVPAPRVG